MLTRGFFQITLTLGDWCGISLKAKTEFVTVQEKLNEETLDIRPLWTFRKNWMICTALAVMKKKWDVTRKEALESEIRRKEYGMSAQEEVRRRREEQF